MGGRIKDDWVIAALDVCVGLLWLTSGVCVCVCLTSSREGLPSDAMPIAGRIHPPPNACDVIPPPDSAHQPLPGEMLADECP
jgi:hypothetical protein